MPTLRSQVKQVYKVGQNCPGFGRSLNGLFKQALTAGKRVRAETSISTGSVSVSSAAVELAQLKLPGRSWDGVRVCIIGAGKMSTLLVKHLLSKGGKEVTVLNRSLPRAEALAAEFPDMKFNIRLMPELMKVGLGARWMGSLRSAAVVGLVERARSLDGVNLNSLKPAHMCPRRC